MNWEPMILLPNIRLRHPVDSELVSIAPPNDPRVLQQTNAHPAWANLLNGFTDAFGVPIEPVTLLIRSDASPSYRSVEAIAGCRDALVASVVPLERAWVVKGGQLRLTFSNSFEIYPWIVGRDNETLVASTPAFLGVNYLDTFRGQSSPELPVMQLSADRIDWAVFDSLIARWTIRFGTAAPAWNDVALFRSLNMANQAMRIPTSHDATLYDIGRSVALWVSAFEILVHLEDSHRVTCNDVYDLLDQVHWTLPETRASHHQVGSGRTGTLAHGLYNRLYRVRNEFFHGNSITSLSSIVQDLFMRAAPVYRQVLTAFLALRPPPEENDKELVDTGEPKKNLGMAADVIERALSGSVSFPGFTEQK